MIPSTMGRGTGLGQGGGQGPLWIMRILFVLGFIALVFKVLVL